MEIHLGRRLQEFTLADVFHLPYGYLLVDGGSDILNDSEERPNVARCVFLLGSSCAAMGGLLRRSRCVLTYRWWKDITSRESWVAVKDGVVESNA